MTNDDGARTLAFGPFRLDTAQGTLLRDGQPVRLSSRPREILLVLVEHAGELVKKRELISRVWPGISVEESVLRVHISILRKILGDAAPGIRYVENVTGLGYRFIARVDDVTPGHATQPEANQQLTDISLPPMPRIIGRETILAQLAARLQHTHFITIVGPGGIGKTTLAMAAAHHMRSLDFRRICFVELGSLADPALVPASVAFSLGLSNVPADPMPGIVNLVKGYGAPADRTLIVLDDCEHLIESVARVAERLLSLAPTAHILATSRERLRAKGESVLRLAPLALPLPSATLTAEDALSFSAVNLFLQRALESLDTFALADADAPIVVDICRKLDGLPLAIELAAARVNVLGVRGLAAQLENRLKLLSRGRRSAPPRHQTLRATLDWSHELLCPGEQVALRRLAVFAGHFDVASANALLSEDNGAAADVLDSVTSLTEKSLVMSSVAGDELLFHLPQTTRAYSLEKLENSGESATLKRRHAVLCCAWGKRPPEGLPRDPKVCFETNLRRIHDVRAALDWCFSAAGDAALGMQLTAASAGVIAQSRRAFWGLWIGHLMAGEYSHGVALAEEFLQAARSSGEAASAVTADRMMMLAHHLAGNQVVARCYGELVLKQYTEGAPPLSDRGRKYDQRVAAYGELARILWMQGFSEQALAAARRSMEHAESFNHTLALCRGLSGAAVVMLWTGDVTQARRLTAQLLEHSTRHSLGGWQLWARCLEAALTQQRAGTLAQVCFELSHHPQCTPFCLDQMATLSEGLVTREALSRAKAQAAGCCTPEILRAAAENLLSADRGNAAAAEMKLSQALRIARDHGALSWELRAAMSLCRLWMSQGRIREARDLLAPVHARFTEGFETQDLLRAQTLLGEIERSPQTAHRLRSG